jgi:glycosyltransferase involved in cell wall biosynthesis
MTGRFRVVALVPDAPDAEPDGLLDGVEVVRFRYAPRRWQTLVNNGGIVTNLRRTRWKWLLVPGFVLGQYLAARRLVKQLRVDVIHAHWLIPQGLVAWRLRQRTSIPFLVTSHGGDLFGLRGRWLQRLKQGVARASSAMTVVSSAMRDEAWCLGLRPPRISVLPMGVDLAHRFVVDSDVNRSTDELLFVGRLVPKKGLLHLLDAMPLVLARRPRVVLTIAGFGPDEALLRARAERLGIADHVSFLGAMSQDDLPALYRRASVFVAPFVRDDSGNQEGLPVALMEAIGCGCPAVVGDVAGVHELLGDAAHSMCVDSKNAQALSAAIVAVLEQPQRARQQAMETRQRAFGLVDWQVIANGYADLLDDCMRGARGAMT